MFSFFLLWFVEVVGVLESDELENLQLILQYLFQLLRCFVSLCNNAASEFTHRNIYDACSTQKTETQK